MRDQLSGLRHLVLIGNDPAPNKASWCALNFPNLESFRIIRNQAHNGRPYNFEGVRSMCLQHPTDLKHMTIDAPLSRENALLQMPELNLAQRLRNEFLGEAGVDRRMQYRESLLSLVLPEYVEYQHIDELLQTFTKLTTLTFSFGIPAGKISNPPRNVFPSRSYPLIQTVTTFMSLYGVFDPELTDMACLHRLVGSHVKLLRIRPFNDYISVGFGFRFPELRTLVIGGPIWRAPAADAQQTTAREAIAARLAGFAAPQLERVIVCAPSLFFPVNGWYRYIPTVADYKAVFGDHVKFVLEAKWHKSFEELGDAVYRSF